MRRVPTMVKRGLVIVATVVMLLGVVINCDSSSGSSGLGCDGMDAIPDGGFPHSQHSKNLVQVRLTASAFTFLSNNLSPLMSAILGENGLSFTLPAKSVNTAGVIIPRSDYTINLEMVNVSIVPVAPDSIKIIAGIKSPGSQGLNLSIPSTVAWVIDCNFTAKTSTPFMVGTKVTLSIDTNDALTFSVADPEFDINAITLGGCALGTVADWVKGWFEGLIKDQIKKAIDDALNGFLCYSCQKAEDCPLGSTCSNELCMQTSSQCMKKPLGIEGAINLGDLLKSALPNAHDAELYFAALAGGDGSNMVDTGLNLRMYGGTKAPNPATDCLTPVTYPRTDVTAFPYGDSFDSPAKDYHAAIGITETLLDQAGTNLYNSGVLCLTIDNTMPSVGTFLDISLFAMLLGSIDTYIHGKSAPVSLSLQPTQPIDFTIGRGEITMETDPKDPTKKVPVLKSPLLTVTIPKLYIHVYTTVEDRTLRLFSIKTDLKVALGLLVGDNYSSLEVVMGDNPIALENMEVPFSILAEEPAAIVDTMNSIIGAALGMFDLTTLIPAIEIPAFDLNGDDVNDLALQILKIGPDWPYTGNKQFKMLSVYAKLALPSKTLTADNRADTLAVLSDAYLPPRDMIGDRSLSPAQRFPSVTILLDAALPGGLSGEQAEYSYRIDNGLWTPFVSADRFTIRDPRLLLQRRHRIEVRSRMVDAPNTTDLTPAAVEFVTDFTAPTVTLLRQGGKLLITATDNVSTASAVALSWRIDGGSWEPLMDDSIPVDSCKPGKVVEVMATDEMGLSAIASYTVPEPQSAARTVNGTPVAAPESSGCNGGGSLAGMLLMAAFGVWLSLRRRFRSAATPLVALAAVGVTLLAMACSDDKPAAVPCFGPDDCNPGFCCVDGACKSCGVLPDGDSEPDQDLVSEEVDTKEPDAETETEGEGEFTPPDTCTTNADCVVDGAPADMFYCTRRGTCAVNDCYGDTPNAMCFIVKNSTCAYCQKNNGINSCALDRCTTIEDCACQTCTDEGSAAQCDMATGLCVCRKPCGGECPSATMCCLNQDAADYNSCVECPVFCKDLECPAGYEKNIPSDWSYTGDRCANIYNVDTCAAQTSITPEDCSIEKACKPLPPIPVGHVGRYLSFVADSQFIHMAAYNDSDASTEGYGDLMYAAVSPDAVGLHPTDNIDKAKISWEFVDGVPTTGKIEGDPNGPRGGVTDPGEDVGTHTSIVLGSDGQPMIAYHDVTNGALKFAFRSINNGSSKKDASGLAVWTVMTVDDGSAMDDPGNPAGKAGLYADITLTRDGNPVIAYQWNNEATVTNSRSELRLAVAKVAHPTTAEDWHRIVVDATDNPRKPCYGACGEGQICREFGDGCYPTNDGTCAGFGGCPAGMVCFNSLCYDTPSVDAQKQVCGATDAGAVNCAAGKVCLPDAIQGCASSGDAIKPSVMVDFPHGVGLFVEAVQFPESADASTSNKFILFYYHRDSYDGAWHNVTTGALKAAIFNGPLTVDNLPADSSAFSVTTLAGASTAEDKGRFLSVDVASNGWFVVAYLNATLNRLEYYGHYENSSSVMQNKIIVADDGVRSITEDGKTRSYVALNGADTAALLGMGTVQIAYQDQTNAELMYLSATIGETITKNNSNRKVLLGGARQNSCGGEGQSACACTDSCSVCSASGYLCSGAYGFYTGQLLYNQSVFVVGSFYYDLFSAENNPDAGYGWGVWFTYAD